jgi:hypothetical protein
VVEAAAAAAVVAELLQLLQEVSRHLQLLVV